MKKTKKIISYIMLLVPLSLPAACSPISTGGSRHSGGSDQQAETDEAEQLRLIVERYFEEQERLQAQAAPQWIDVTADGEDDADDSVNAAAVESEQDLQDELEGLKKTGEWTAAEPEGGTQCNLTGAGEPIWPEKRELPEAAELEAADLKAMVPELIPSQPVKQAACGFPVLVNKQVEYYLNLFQGKQRKNFRRWLERSGKYLPFITQELNKAGLPLELAWLALIESGFNPSAYSRSHASGLWQFIPSTGHNYGLRIDSWADERRDPEKATKAAIAYLQALYKRFGDWHLAVAAYNAGEGSIERGLKKYNAKNFWQLAQHDYLSLETKRYVPQMIAAIMISRDPEQYGFRGIRYRRPVRHEVVRVPAGTPLKAVAASAAVSMEQLRELNNDLLQDRAPNSKGGWLLKVPAGQGALVAANLSGTLHGSSFAEGGTYRSHKVAKNETLSGISEKYHVSMTDLLKVNNLRSAKLLAGQYLRIPSAAASSDGQQYALTASKKQAVVTEQVAAADTTTTYKLGRGETLSHVSDKYKVSVAALMKWNNISKASSIQAGQKLTIHLPQDEIKPADVQLAAAAPSVAQSNGLVELNASGTKLKPGTTVDAPAKTVAAAEQKSSSGGVVMLAGKGKRKAADVEEAAVSYYKVRNGDSLWSISKKLQVSTNDIKDWNSLNGNMLQPGTTLVIKNG